MPAIHSALSIYMLAYLSKTEDGVTGCGVWAREAVPIGAVSAPAQQYLHVYVCVASSISTIYQFQYQDPNHHDRMLKTTNYMRYQQISDSSSTYNSLFKSIKSMWCVPVVWECDAFVSGYQTVPDSQHPFLFSCQLGIHACPLHDAQHLIFRIMSKKNPCSCSTELPNSIDRSTNSCTETPTKTPRDFSRRIIRLCRDFGRYYSLLRYLKGYPTTCDPSCVAQ